jgi:hypothetical protein
LMREVMEAPEDQLRISMQDGAVMLRYSEASGSVARGGQ